MNGLICEKCPIYLATREQDKDKQYKMRTDIAQCVKKIYGEESRPEDIGDCDGCKAETGRLFCTSCDIRNCAVQKGIENCAYCDNYPCELLEKLYTTDLDAKKRLDDIRNTL
ncbi:MAG: DUF3795 domain-containing protein [Planctomycetota bacterium]|jgi:hypothetical protein